MKGTGTGRGLQESSSWSILEHRGTPTAFLYTAYAVRSASRLPLRATIVDTPVGGIMGMYTIARLRNIIESLPRSKATKPMYNTQTSDEYHCHMTNFGRDDSSLGTARSLCSQYHNDRSQDLAQPSGIPYYHPSYSNYKHHCSQSRRVRYVQPLICLHAHRVCQILMYKVARSQ